MDTYLVKELDGCRVVTEAGEYLGDLKDVLPSGGNDVFVVRNAAKEVMIPALKSVVLHIDLTTRVITVTLPKGLREIYEI